MTILLYKDGRLLIEARTPLAARGGKVGFTADCPARFSDFEARVTAEEAEAIEKRLAEDLAKRFA